MTLLHYASYTSGSQRAEPTLRRISRRISRSLLTLSRPLLTLARTAGTERAEPMLRRIEHEAEAVTNSALRKLEAQV